MKRLLEPDAPAATLVAWLMAGDEDARRLLRFVLTSSLFVRVLRLRCHHECATPCRPADLKALPCRWSARVLEAFADFLEANEGAALRPFLDSAHRLELLEYLSITLHETFHPAQLEQHGFLVMSPFSLPGAVRALFDEDATFRTLFEMRWLEGITEESTLAALWSPPLLEEALHEALERLDTALMEDPVALTATDPWKRLEERRMESGIPLRALWSTPRP